MNEGTQEQEHFVLEARLTNGSKWEEMSGFAYGTLEELQAVYDKHFRAIDGQGCVYRFKHEHMTLVTKILAPAPGGAG
jgi:hypothetical protein